MRNYKIALASLGHLAVGQPTWQYKNLSELSNERLAFNLANLYAWDLRSEPGFQADGPCTFISYS